MKFNDIPSGNLTVCYWKWQFFMGKSTISMAMFNSYVKLPEGMWKSRFWLGIRIDSRDLKSMSPKALVQWVFWLIPKQVAAGCLFAPFWLHHGDWPIPTIWKCGSNLLAPNLSESHSHSFRQQRPNQRLLLVPFLIYIVANQGNHHALSCGWL